MSSREITDDMAVLVIGFDGYSDLWDDFFYLLNHNWRKRKFRTYLSNNVLDKNYENVEVIKCGKEAEWSKKVRDAVNAIPEKYICLLLEDFYIGELVDDELISNTLEYIDNRNIKYYKLKNFTKVSTKNFDGKSYLKSIPQNLGYGISLQPAIWEREFLLKLLGEGNYNAWKFEYNRLEESSTSNSEIFTDCVYDNRNILNIQHGVVQGKYIPPTVKFFEDKNYKLNTSKRRVMTSYEYSVYRMKLIGKELIPQHLNEHVKRLMKLFGMRFVSDKYK